MYPLCLRYAYVIHPLLQLSIRFFRYASALKLSPITSLELSSSSIRFHPPHFPYSFVKHQCYILPLSVLFPFRFRKFSTVLSNFWADANGWYQPRNFVFIGQWDRAFSQCVVMHNVIFVPIQHFSFQDWMPRMLIKFRVYCNRDFVGFQSSREDATSFCPRLQPSWNCRCGSVRTWRVCGWISFGDGYLSRNLISIW